MYDEFLYFGACEEKKAHDIFSGKARVKLKERITHSAGETYFLHPFLMHRVIFTAKELTSTLIFHPKPAKKWARTITISGKTPNSHQEFMEISELKKVFKLYIQSQIAI